MIDIKITATSMGTILKKSSIAQSTKVSEHSESSSLVTKPYYGPMPNIKIITLLAISNIVHRLPCWPATQDQ